METGPFPELQDITESSFTPLTKQTGEQRKSANQNERKNAYHHLVDPARKDSTCLLRHSPPAPAPAPDAPLPRSLKLGPPETRARPRTRPRSHFIHYARTRRARHRPASAPGYGGEGPPSPRTPRDAACCHLPPRHPRNSSLVAP